MKIGRRDLLAYTSGVAAAGLASTAAGLASVIDARDVHFDAVCDVLVAGSGIAGICAALGSLDHGLDVALVESQEVLGGSTAMSGGVLYLGGGTRLQRKLGFDDTAENMYAFLTQGGSAPSSFERVKVYCEGSVEHFDWLVGQGVKFSNRFSKGSERPADDASLYYSGNETAAAYAAFSVPCPRGHVAAVEGRTGHYLIKTLTAQAIERGLRPSLSSAIEELIVSGSDGVVGAKVSTTGGMVAIRAKRGVVIACGGFTQNKEMLRMHAPALALCSPLSGPGDLGTGIRIASALGAETLRMDDGFSIIPLPSPVYGVIVNRHGYRIVAEDAYYGVVGHEIAFNQGGVAYLIVDAKTDSSVYSQNFHRILQAATLVDIASGLGMNGQVLESTISAYNAQAASGVDRMFGKSSKHLTTLDKPLWSVYDLSVGSTYFPAHTFGGLHTDMHGRVMHVDGAPIPGLYAAGRSSRGIPSGPYLASGLSLGDGSYFGRRAADHLAAVR